MRRDWLWVALIVSVLLNVFFCCDGIATYVERADKMADEMLKDSVVIEDTARVVAPTANSESLLRYDEVVLERADVKIEKTEREPNDKEDNFPNKTVTELPESVQKFPESVQKFPESDKNLQDSIQNFGESVTDSVKVRLPITQKVYEDSMCKVWVSGYNPKVDSVDVFQRRVYYPVAVEKGREDPKIVITIGPYIGFGNKGFNYGVAVNIGVPLSRLKWW